MASQASEDTPKEWCQKLVEENDLSEKIIEMFATVEWSQLEQINSKDALVKLIPGLKPGSAMNTIYERLVETIQNRKRDRGLREIECFAADPIGTAKSPMTVDELRKKLGMWNEPLMPPLDDLLTIRPLDFLRRLFDELSCTLRFYIPMVMSFYNEENGYPLKFYEDELSFVEEENPETGELEFSVKKIERKDSRKIYFRYAGDGKALKDFFSLSDSCDALLLLSHMRLSASARQKKYKDSGFDPSKTFYRVDPDVIQKLESLRSNTVHRQLFHSMREFMEVGKFNEKILCLCDEFFQFVEFPIFKPAEFFDHAPKSLKDVKKAFHFHYEQLIRMKQTLGNYRKLLNKAFLSQTSTRGRDPLIASKEPVEALEYLIMPRFRLPDSAHPPRTLPGTVSSSQEVTDIPESIPKVGRYTWVSDKLMLSTWGVCDLLAMTNLDLMLQSLDAFALALHKLFEWMHNDKIVNQEHFREFLSGVKQKQTAIKGKPLSIQGIPMMNLDRDSEGNLESSYDVFAGLKLLGDLMQIKLFGGVSQEFSKHLKVLKDSRDLFSHCQHIARPKSFAFEKLEKILTSATYLLELVFSQLWPHSDKLDTLPEFKLLKWKSSLLNRGSGYRAFRRRSIEFGQKAKHLKSAPAEYEELINKLREGYFLSPSALSCWNSLCDRALPPTQKSIPASPKPSTSSKKSQGAPANPNGFACLPVEGEESEDDRPERLAGEEDEFEE